jgi:hypothetical protein
VVANDAVIVCAPPFAGTRSQEDPGPWIQCGRLGCVCRFDTEHGAWDCSSCSLERHCDGDDDVVQADAFGRANKNKQCFLCQRDNNARQKKAYAKRPKQFKKMRLSWVYAFYVGPYLTEYLPALCVTGAPSVRKRALG